MADFIRPLFDFGTESEDYSKTIELIRQFAAHDAFRSATVEELVLDEDCYRRPVRPEDLSFIDFSQATEESTVTQLPFLAAQRILLAVNELRVARVPNDTARLPDAARFYEARNQVLGSQIRPFLEAFAFSFLDRQPNSDPTISGLNRRFSEIIETDARRWSRLVGNLIKADYVEDGLRYVLIQVDSLAPSRNYAVAAAAGYGFVDFLEAATRPRITTDFMPRNLAEACGLTKRAHSYWQFYLSTSLASCNFLHALGSRPDHQLQMLGAAFFAEAQQLAFGCLIGQVAQRLGVDDGDVERMRNTANPSSLLSRFEAAVRTVDARFGLSGLQQVSQGFDAAASLNDVGWRNLSEQLRWLSSIDRYQAIAQAIDKRIHAECPDIDRETFVEPREMCSTTHVHDDHRLVVIESGDMVFWGNLGMNLRLKPGEMILVPQGRLHGSSIESDVCTYHQPIIPEQWIQPLVADVTRDFADL
jgi:mannose-6-phosphate isomerase-like protein (cupin superfamily)